MLRWSNITYPIIVGAEYDILNEFNFSCQANTTMLASEAINCFNSTYLVPLELLSAFGKSVKLVEFATVGTLNKSSEGLLGALIREEIHTTLTMKTINEERLRLTSMSLPFLFTKPAFFYQIPGSNAFDESPFFLVAPLSITVWILCILAIALSLIADTWRSDQSFGLFALATGLFCVLYSNNMTVILTLSAQRKPFKNIPELANAIAAGKFKLILYEPNRERFLTQIQTTPDLQPIKNALKTNKPEVGKSREEICKRLTEPDRFPRLVNLEWESDLLFRCQKWVPELCYLPVASVTPGAGLMFPRNKQGMTMTEATSREVGALMPIASKAFYVNSLDLMEQRCRQGVWSKEARTLFGMKSLKSLFVLLLVLHFVAIFTLILETIMHGRLNRWSHRFSKFKRVLVPILIIRR